MSMHPSPLLNLGALSPISSSLCATLPPSWALLDDLDIVAYLACQYITSIHFLVRLSSGDGTIECKVPRTRLDICVCT